MTFPSIIFRSGSQPGAWLAIAGASILFGASAHVCAQAPAPTRAAHTTLIFQSAFEGYQPYADEKILDWKKANDTALRIGGWREYAKQAQQPVAEAPQTTKTGPSTATPHAGHGKP